MKLRDLVVRARQGDLKAYDSIVRQLQDMAVGYAYAQVGDFHMAEDVAQEAFLSAYQDLERLREPDAFSGWFRRIVATQCNRMTRRKQVSMAPLNDASHVQAEGNPEEALEVREMKDQVLHAVNGLPEPERAATTLFYIGEHTQKEVADFLDLPVTTVNFRLHRARKLLKERMLEMVEETLHESAPSQDDRFAEKVMRMVQPEVMKTASYRLGVDEVDGNDAWALLRACVAGDLNTVKTLLNKDPRLINAQYWYQLPVHLAVREGHQEVVRLLFESGADPGQSHYMYNAWDKLLKIARERGHKAMYDFLASTMKERFNYAAEFEDLRTAIIDRDTDRVESIVQKQPDLVRAGDEFGNGPVHWAVMTRQLSLIDRFLDLGADIDAQRADGKTPIQLAMIGDHSSIWYPGYNALTKTEIRIQQPQVLIGYLLAKGAAYNCGIAAAIGDAEGVEALLNVDPAAAGTLDSGRQSPLFWAAQFGHTHIVKMLLDAGADPNRSEELAPRGRALYAACERNDLETAELLLKHGADPMQEVNSCGNCVHIARYYHTDYQEIHELLHSYDGFRLPDNAEEVEDILRRGDRKVIEHREFIRCVIWEDVVKLMVETHPELIACITDSPKTGESVHLLVEHGLDVNKPNWLGKTLLHDSAELGYMEAAAALLESGADINAIELEYGGTPLASAARRGQVEMVRFLLDQGADPDRADGDWATPLAWAKREGHTEVADLLREKST